MLVGSDILKSIVAIIGACSECKNQKLKQICQRRADFLSLCLEFKCTKFERRKCFYTSNKKLMTILGLLIMK